MKRYWTLFSGLVLVLLLLFGAATGAGLDLAVIWSQIAEQPPFLTAFIGVMLLVIDVFLPVPSILVIIGLGNLFGMLVGAALSLLGMVSACMLAFAVGHGGRSHLEGWIGQEEQQRADQLLRRWGGTAIILSRPVPLLAETVAVMAGASTMGWMTALRAGVIGSLPMCLLYAASGSGIEQLDHMGLVCATVVVLAIISWGVGRFLERRLEDENARSV